MKPAKTKRDEFFKDLSAQKRVDNGTIRALKIYFNNRQHSPNKERYERLNLLPTLGPYRLEMQCEADYMHLLTKACYINPDSKHEVWRNTEFTRFFGTQQRNIMNDRHSLYLVDFQDEQTDGSAKWERRNHPDCEAGFFVPIYEMRDSSGNSFQFIIRSWQQGGDRITIV
jgi:hypothetical protein